MPDPAGLPPGAELLLRILRVDHSACLQDLQSLSPTEWEELTNTAVTYRLGAQLLQRLNQIGMNMLQVPASARDRLVELTRLNVQRNLVRQLQLRDLANACEEADIPFLVMKGLWLVELSYQDISIRDSGDIDVLVRADDMPRFTRLLSGLGYALPAEIEDIREVAPSRHEFDVVHHKRKTSLDVHWAITSHHEGTVDEPSFWHRAEKYRLAGRDCLSLGVEDHLLLICFHAAFHHRFLYVGPRSLFDVAQVIKKPPWAIDWNGFVDRARSLGWERGTWLMLELVRVHVGVEPPSFVMDGLRPAGKPNPAVLIAALETMFLDQSHVQRLDTSLVKLFSEASLMKRCRWFLKRFFSPSEDVASHFQVKVADEEMLGLRFKRWWFLLRKNMPMLFELLLPNSARRAELGRSTLLHSWLNTQARETE
jgi:hypothetical protein